MAEDFSNVIKKLESTVKKPSAGKAPAVLAVQMVDSKGKVIKEERGAAVAEAQREEEKRGKLTNTLLSNILKAMGGKQGKEEVDPKAKKGGFLKSILSGLLPAGMIGMLGGASILGKLGIGAIALAGIWAAVDAIGDGLEGMEWAKTMGMEKESGFIARFFAGDIEGGLMNAFKQSMKGAAMGATLGMAGGPVGMIVGALLGAALFGIAGYFGAGALAKMIDPLVQDARKLFGLAVNVTPEELAEAKKIAATTLQLKNDAIANVKKLTDQIVTAQAATEPDQELIDKLILLKTVAMKEALEVHKKHEEAATKALELDRQAERNAVIAAEDAVARNKVEILRLNSERRRFEREVKLYGEDTLEGQVAAANLAATRVKLRKTRTEGETLREEEAAAEAVLLTEDRRLIKEAKEKGGIAPWRARFNVWTTDTWNDLKESWSSLKTWAVTWFANNIFDPGSGPVGDFDSGTPMRIFGVAIPSMKEVTGRIRESWSSLKTWAVTWFKDNIYSPAVGKDTPPKLFGIELKIPDFDITMPTKEELMAMLPEWMRNFKLPKLENLTMPDFNLKENWDKFTASIPQWIKNNIFDPGAEGRGGSGGGRPMKIFGMEIKFPSLNISFTGMADKILSILPRWLTDPVAYITEVISDMMAWLPDILKPDAPMDPKLKEGALAAIDKKIAVQDAYIATQEAKEGAGASKLMAEMGRKKLDKLIAQRTEIEGKKIGGPVKKGVPYLVGEGSVNPELFIPSSSGMILSAQRTQQMMQAGILRGMGGGDGGGTTAINTGGNVVNAPTTNYVNNGIAARRPIILAA